MSDSSASERHNYDSQFFCLFFFRLEELLPFSINRHFKPLDKLMKKHPNSFIYVCFQAIITPSGRCPGWADTKDWQPTTKAGRKRAQITPIILLYSSYLYLLSDQRHISRDGWNHHLHSCIWAKKDCINTLAYKSNILAQRGTVTVGAQMAVFCCQSAAPQTSTFSSWQRAPSFIISPHNKAQIHVRLLSGS